MLCDFAAIALGAVSFGIMPRAVIGNTAMRRAVRITCSVDNEAHLTPTAPDALAPDRVRNGPGRGNRRGGGRRPPTSPSELIMMRTLRRLTTFARTVSLGDSPASMVS